MLITILGAVILSLAFVCLGMSFYYRRLDHEQYPHARSGVGEMMSYSGLYGIVGTIMLFVAWVMYDNQNAVTTPQNPPEVIEPITNEQGEECE